MQEAWEEHKKALEELSIPKIHELKDMPPGLETKINDLMRDSLEASAELFEPDRHQEPRQYYEPPEGTGGLPAVICTCGWSKRHLRFKVLMAASEKHYNKTGHPNQKDDNDWT